MALGFGFRCGFLGLLHMEIVQERLEREFGLDLIASAPSVEYRVTLTNGRGEVEVDNPAELPDAGEIEAIEEPWVKLSVITPSAYIGALMELVDQPPRRFEDMEYLDPQRVQLAFELPLAELIVDYYDQLKSRTPGLRLHGLRGDRLPRGEPGQAGRPGQRRAGRRPVADRPPRPRRRRSGRRLVEKLQELIPRQMFEVPIQAAVGCHVIARETVRAMRKNVLAKCYGGDITRKRKLLEKQKEGKQRMKRVGSVEIPQEAFLAVLRTDEDMAACQPWRATTSAITSHLPGIDAIRSRSAFCIAVGLALLLILRLDADRFGAAEYDDADRPGRPAAPAPARLVRAGADGIAAGIVVAPHARSEPVPGLGDRRARSSWASVFGAAGHAHGRGLRLAALPPPPPALGARSTRGPSSTRRHGVHRRGRLPRRVLGFLIAVGLDPTLAQSSSRRCSTGWPRASGRPAAATSCCCCPSRSASSAAG